MNIPQVLFIILNICIQFGAGRPTESEVAAGQGSVEIEDTTDSSIESTDAVTTTKYQNAVTFSTEILPDSKITTKPSSSKTLTTAPKLNDVTPKKSDSTPTTSSTNGHKHYPDEDEEYIVDPFSTIDCPTLADYLGNFPRNDWIRIKVASGGHIKSGVHQFLTFVRNHISKDKKCIDMYLTLVLPTITQKDLESYENWIEGMIRFRPGP